jgi:Co/Zn/Cd efflux system component
MAREVVSRSTIKVPGMDCDAEAALVRAALQGVPGLVGVVIDPRARLVVIDHSGSCEPVLRALTPLGFGAVLQDQSTVAAPVGEAAAAHSAGTVRRALAIVLTINAVMFVLELIAGLVAGSTGLIADSLDMLADASVYAIALAAAADPAAQRRAGRTSGWLQLGLAGLVLADVLRRAASGGEPVDWMMIAVGLLALTANTVCLALLARHRGAGAHLRASWIFTTNDTLANLGVIAAGLLVAATGSQVPDLVIGTAIAVLVASGAVRILRSTR